MENMYLIFKGQKKHIPKEGKRDSSDASAKQISTPKNQIPQNRPKFIYHKVSALSANSFPSETIFDRYEVKHSQRMITSSNGRSNVTVERIGAVTSKTNYPNKIKLVTKRGKEGQKLVDDIKTSFRYMSFQKINIFTFRLSVYNQIFEYSFLFAVIGIW